MEETAEAEDRLSEIAQKGQSRLENQPGGTQSYSWSYESNSCRCVIGPKPRRAPDTGIAPRGRA